MSLTKHILAAAFVAVPVWASVGWCAEPEVVPNAPVRGVVVVEPGAGPAAVQATPTTVGPGERAAGAVASEASGERERRGTGEGANVGPEDRAAGATAPVTRPVSAAAGGGASGVAVGGSGGEIRRSRVDGAATQPAGSINGMVGGAVYETLRVVIALGLVLALIVGLKVVAGKVLGIRTGAGGPNRGVRVLSRTVVSPKQQLLLIQAGRRLILVSESAGQLTTLTEFSDPDEVAELSAQALGTAKSGGGGGGGGGGFGSLFGKRAGEYDEFEDDEMTTDGRVAVPARRTEEGVVGVEEAGRMVRGDGGDGAGDGGGGGSEFESLSDRIKALNRRLAAS